MAIEGMSSLSLPAPFARLPQAGLAVPRGPDHAGISTLWSNRTCIRKDVVASIALSASLWKRRPGRLRVRRKKGIGLLSAGKCLKMAKGDFRFFG